MTVHRPSNTDNKKHMQSILSALDRSGKTVVFPVHPRTQKYLKEYGLWDWMPKNIICVDPLGYLDMLNLLSKADKVLTDSGGVQKEAYLSGIPCITLRENTEWVETVEDGWNVLVGADEEKIYSALSDFLPSSSQRDLFVPVGASGNCRFDEQMMEILFSRITDFFSNYRSMGWLFLSPLPIPLYIQPLFMNRSASIILRPSIMTGIDFWVRFFIATGSNDL